MSSHAATADLSRPASSRNNNFGILRLLFALLVIVSHSPELVDGNRSREILTQIFGTMSFGEIAVDGFFLISGFLVTKSFVASRSLTDYLVKRVLRIFPAYFVSFWLCVLVLAPFVSPAGWALSIHTIWPLIVDMLRLLPPDVPGAFHGLHYPALDGAMWTIAIEFRCYLAAALLGACGLFRPRRRLFVLAAVVIGWIVHLSGGAQNIHPFGDIFGPADYNLRFLVIFGVGAIYYLYSERIALTGASAFIAALLLFALLFNHAAAETALILFGGYLLFWFAFKTPVLRASRLANAIDISYGLYLYAWPIQNWFIWNDRTIAPWLLCLMTIPVAGLMGYASWILVEKPALRLARADADRRAQKTDSAVQSA